MSNGFFRASPQTDIYHTLSLWSRLSPHLTRGEKKNSASQGTKKAIGGKRGKKARSIEPGAGDILP